MSFPYKIDRDAVADLQPYDTWLLQRLADGAEHVRKKRLRRHSFAWPYAKAPIIANFETGAYMLGLWRLSPHVTEITVTLRHKTTVDTVKVGLAALTDGGLSTLEPTTEVSTNANTQQTELTLDVTPFQHLEVVPIFLLVRSTESTDVVNNTSADVSSWTTRYVSMNTGTYTPLTAGGRYVLRAYDSSGSVSPILFPEKRQIIYDDSGRWYVWPRMDDSQLSILGSEWIGLSYDVEATRLGQMQLFGFSIVETDSIPPADLKPALRAGRPPSMLPIGQLYTRMREVLEKQTRVYHFGPQHDPAKLDGSDLVQPWGNFVRYARVDADPDDAPVPGGDGRAVAGALLGQYPTSRLPDGTVQTMSTIDVYGAVMIFSAAEGTFNYQPKLWMHSYDSGTGRYSDDEVTAAGSPVAARSHAVNPTNSELAHLWMAVRGLNPSGPQYHYLRGAIPTRFLATGRARISVFKAQITDAHPADQRLLRLSLAGARRSREGRSIANNDTHQFALLTMTAVGAEQVF